MFKEIFSMFSFRGLKLVYIDYAIWCNMWIVVLFIIMYCNNILLKSSILLMKVEYVVQTF
jgi:hypothetical protein